MTGFYITMDVVNTVSKMCVPCDTRQGTIDYDLLLPASSARLLNSPAISFPVSSTIPLKHPPSCRNRSHGLPNSTTLPSPITKIRLSSITVSNQCATDKIVAPSKLSLTAACSNRSVLPSTSPHVCSLQPLRTFLLLYVCILQTHENRDCMHIHYLSMDEV